jgi:predicted branched-subunit amino acid permease
MLKANREWFSRGIRDGIPIALGYFAVSFTLGIAAKKAGLSPFQAALASLLNNASAGEFAGFTLIAAGAGLWEIAVMELIANARYLLMSFALSQKLEPGTGTAKRLLLGFDVTDELFGIATAVPGKLNPFYIYGAMLVAIPGWSSGTWLGAVMGNILPVRIVSALGVGLYGMFLACIIPPAKKDRIVAALIVVCFAASWAFQSLPCFAWIPSGTKVILLTLLLAGGAAVLFPVPNELAKAEKAVPHAE